MALKYRIPYVFVYKEIILSKSDLLRSTSSTDNNNKKEMKKNGVIPARLYFFL